MTTLREAAQQALEALEYEADRSNDDAYKKERDALRAALAEPVQEPVDSPEKAGAYMDARLWEFIDMAAAWPEAKTDTRTWDHVLVYAPKQLEQEPVAWYFEARHIDSAWAAAVTLKHPGPEGKYMRKVTPLYTAPPQRPPLTEEEISAIDWKAGETLHDFARAIEKAHGIGTEACATLAEPHTGVMLKPVLYANRRLTNEEVDAVVERKENT